MSMNNIGDKFMTSAAKIGSQRHMIVIRDSFASLMPILMAGAVAVTINAIPGIINDILGTQISLPAFVTSINGAVWFGSFSLITIYVVLLIAYNLAKSYDTNVLASMVIGFACYVAAASTDDDGWTAYAGAAGLLLGIIISILSVEMFRKLYQFKGLLIKMPDSVPPAVSRSFASLTPGIITLFVFSAIAITIKTASGVSVFSLVQTLISEPLSKLSDNLFTVIFFVLLIHLLWAVGLHGPNIIEGPLQAIYLSNLEANMAHFDLGGSATDAPFIVTKPFLDTFVHMGGAGVTLGLIISIFIVSRAKVLRTTAKLSLGPGLFNINEPVIFGLPIVLNPVFAIPFILAPIVLTIISYLATSIGLVGKTVVMTHWAMPPIISGFLATGGDIKGVILQIVNLVISVVIYIPFVIIANRQELKKENQMK